MSKMIESNERSDAETAWEERLQAVVCHVNNAVVEEKLGNVQQCGGVGGAEIILSNLSLSLCASLTHDAQGLLLNMIRKAALSIFSYK